MHTKILIFLLVLILSIPAYGNPDNNLYLRSDTKTANGVVVETNLLMVPADNDFRIKQFNSYIITGRATKDAQPDAYSAAKKDAFLNLLLLRGVKSIKNRSELRDSIQYAESVLSYEGFLKSTYTLTKQEYNADRSELLVEMEVMFAPIAYPTEWSYYYFKKKLSELMRNMISVF